MRRRGNSEVGLNLDSLLDTLTNVIGFLLIMLVLMKLGVSQAVERIREIDPSAFALTEADIEKAEAEAQKQSDELSKLKENADALKEEMALLRDPAADAPKVVPLDQAKKQLADAKSKVDEKEKEQKIRQTEVARLKERMGRTPRAAAPAPHEIRMPDPRAAPEGMSAMWVMCKGNRAAMIDVDATRAEIKKQMKDPRIRQGLLMRSLGGLGGAGKAIPPNTYDPDRVTRYFSSKPIRNRDYAATVKTFDNRASANIVIAMLKNGGEDIKQMKRDRSKMRRALEKAKESKKYIRFLVYGDSFESYLTARSLADEADVPAGWEIFRNPVWEVGLGGDIKIFQKKKPPPRPKTTLKTPQPKRKTPPPRVID